jgi:hypothetical protein
MTSLRREAAIFLGLLALTAALRLPFAGLVHPDEAFFALVGRDWLDGFLPYVDRFDVKPPGLFLLYALAEDLVGPGVAAIKGLEILAVALGAYGLWRIGETYFSRQVGLAAALLYPVYMLAMSGVFVPAALFLNACEIYAVWAALRGGFGLSGFLFGCAFTLKQSAAVEAASVFFALLAAAPDARARGVLALRFALAGAAAPLAFVGYFAAEGALAPFWSATVLAAGGRLGGDNVGFIEGLARLPGGLRPMLALVAGATLAVLRWRGLSGPARLVLAWAAGALVAVVAMRAMYDHYFLPLAPPLLLLSATVAFDLLDLGARRAVALAGMGVAALAVPLVFGMSAVREDGEDFRGLAAIEQAARAAGLRPGASALVVDRGVRFYLDTGARPAYRVFHPQQLLCPFPALSGDMLAQALAARPEFVLLADERLGMVCELPERMALLREKLAADYTPVGASAGDWDRFELFRRK